MHPPSTPTRWVESPPRKYSRYETGAPTNGRFITSVLKTKLLRNTPTEKITKALYGVAIPARGAVKSVRSMAAATKR